MATWENLVMWDNISFYYGFNKPVSEEQLKEIKKVLNNYTNNIAYNGYIKKNKVNMHPSITIGGTKIDYNVSAYPSPLPKNCPSDLFNIFPNEIKLDDLILSKKSYWDAI